VLIQPALARLDDAVIFTLPVGFHRCAVSHGGVGGVVG
jgi:hypothetical protein